jgi:hypothetical protein
MTINYCKGVNLLLLISALMSSACNKSEDAQTSRSANTGLSETQQANPAEPGSLSAIESLAAPIALYSEPLLAEVLIAATYPPEIAIAARRLETGPGADAANGKDLDASVQRLARLPQVIIMMNEHPQWTTALGDAFLAQPDALFNAMQSLRQHALQSGYLKDSAAQKVLKTIASAVGVNGKNSVPVPEEGSSAQAATREAIYIQPAEAGKIRVPLYDPATVFSASLAPQPAGAGNTYSAQQPEAIGAGDAYSADFYPTYYSVSAETGDNGAAMPAFSAGGAVDGLSTWGSIEWNNLDGYGIKHRYGNLTDCNKSDDCWLRAADNGYRYADELMPNAGESGNGEPGIPWRHDSRHRRGLGYGQEAGKRLGALGPPPLAGQRLSAALPPLSERGFDTFDSVQSAGDREADNVVAKDFLSQEAEYNALNGLADFKAGGGAEITRGRESRNREKTATQNPEIPVPSDTQRPAGKPIGKQTPQLDALRELQLQLQRRETALSGVFEAVGGNAKLIGLFSSRGAQSRGHKTLSERGAATSAHPKQAQEEAD